MATALVTGGTSGIGAEFARQLAARGDDLVLVARDETRLEEMAAELRALGRDVEVLPADLAERDDVDRVAARLEDPERPIDLLVNNAGFSVHALLTSKDRTRHDLGLEVMVRAVHVLASAAARAMRARGHGAIINLGSVAGYITMGSYSAMKSWVTVFSESLANELHGTGVTVTVLAPGWVRTEFHERGNVSVSKIPNALWVDKTALVRTCLRDSAKGKVISVPSARFAFLTWLLRHLPRSTVRWVSRGISSSRSDTVAE